MNVGDRVRILGERTIGGSVFAKERGTVTEVSDGVAKVMLDRYGFAVEMPVEVLKKLPAVG